MTTAAQEPEAYQLACSEIWGGNSAVDEQVVVEGVDAWIYSEPYQHESSGGDLYYFSR